MYVIWNQMKVLTMQSLCVMPAKSEFLMKNHHHLAIPVFQKKKKMYKGKMQGQNLTKRTINTITFKKYV